MSEIQKDAVLEDSSDLNEELDNDELAEPSTALDENSDPSPEDDDNIKLFESERANQRFSKLTQESKATRTENEALRARLMALESTAIPEFNDPGAPTLEGFEYDQDAFNAASINYQVSRAVHSERQAAQVAQRQSTERATKDVLMQGHQAKRVALATTVKDFDQVINTSYLNNQTLGGNAAADAMLLSPNSADIEYHVGKNPDLAVRLNNMNQVQASMEIARLSDSLKVKPKPSASLPDPVGATPSGGGRSATDKFKHISGAKFE